MVARAKNFNGIKNILKKARQHQTSKEELDSIFLVCGEEGSGKSTFILDCIEIYEQITKQELNINYLARNLKELIVMLKISKSKGFLALDEGSELASDRQWEGIMKGLKKGFTVMRQKAMIVLLSYPNPFKINTYFREDRAKGLFFTYKRKYVYFFTRTAFQDIQRDMRMRNKGVKSIGDFIKQYGNKATLIDTFPDYEGHLLKEYKKRKTQNIDDTLQELYEEFGVDEKLFSLSQACKYLGMNDDLLRKYLRYEEDTEDPSRVIPVQWNLAHTKMKLKEKDLIDFKIWYTSKLPKTAKEQAHPNIRPEILKQNPEAES